ncbi:hypothetical protein PDQ75_24945 [Bacillus cereus group sp. Bc015]|uniref:hypothetical protein n=1 Tax=Bacillus cereus group sp. Bc015 TaxID=3018123 RepID=UPI0022E2E7BA|nr:hypothetical protein [Bacillus cereus group sp. Bc015]MDA2738404.1 hypothetical protein [Bacillus cereus group sp. Bc015]
MKFKKSDVDGNAYIDDQREQYKKRTGFTDTQYYKVVTLSCKFYLQAVETGKDIKGNQLSEEDISICEMLYNKMQKEIAIAEANFNKEREQS